MLYKMVSCVYIFKKLFKKCVVYKSYLIFACNI